MSPEEWDIICKDTLTMEVKKQEVLLESLRVNPIARLLAAGSNEEEKEDE